MKRLKLATLFLCLNLATTALAAGTNLRNIYLSGELSDGNSTVASIANGASFTGTWEQTYHPQVGTQCYSDQALTLYFQFSNNADGSNPSVFPVNGFNMAAGITEFHTAVKLGRYFRIVLQNDSGSTASTVDCRVYYGSNFIPSNTPLNQAISSDNDAIVVRPTGYINDVCNGLISGASCLRKFGFNLDVDSGASETLWSAGGNWAPLDVAGTFNIFSSDTNDDRGDTGCGVVEYRCTGVGGLDFTGTIEMDGTNVVESVDKCETFLRAKCIESGDSHVNEGNITITGTMGTQAYIPANYGITQQLIFEVPTGSSAFILGADFSGVKISGGGAPVITVTLVLRSADDGTKTVVLTESMDTAVQSIFPIIQQVYDELPAGTKVEMRASTDSDNTIVQGRLYILLRGQ